MAHTSAADLAIAEALLHATMHEPTTPAPIRLALIVRAVVRRTSPRAARITSVGWRLVFPEPLLGGWRWPS